MDETSWSSKRRIFKVSCSFPRERLRKTWNEVIRSDMKKKTRPSEGLARKK